MTHDDIRAAVSASPELRALADARADGWTDAIAERLSETLPPRIVPATISERGVRILPVAPRHRFALLRVLRQAEQAPPAWLSPALTAAGVPPEDHEAIADDLACAHRWLLQEAGIDVGTAAVRSLLDLIAQAVPDAAPACDAAKALAEQDDAVSEWDVRVALLADDGSLRI